MMASETPPWTEHPDLVKFYAHHRNRPEDLYPSERRFLPWLAAQAVSVLDIGCAAGGFRNIWRRYRSEIRYLGVDRSASLIEAASRLEPDGDFFRGDCAEGLPFPDRVATVVQALGWLHWEPRYPQVLRELWRLTDRYLFLDIRLAGTPDRTAVGRQHVALSGPWDGQTTTPYLVVEWSSFSSLLDALEPATVFGCGYWGSPADTVVGVEGPVCFAAFVLEKPSLTGRASVRSVCLDLPLAWPTALSQRVHVLPGAALSVLVPQG